MQVLVIDGSDPKMSFVSLSIVLNDTLEQVQVCKVFFFASFYLAI